MNLNTDTERAWAAGLFDGEGSTSYAVQTRKGSATWLRQIRLRVGQAGDPTVLVRFMDAVGCGRIYGPYASKGGKHKPTFEYSAHCFEEVQWALIQLWPWLSRPKRAQAALVFKLYLGDAKNSRSSHHSHPSITR